MHIIFVVDNFPELTFIFRTILAIAERGHKVTVVAIKRGEWKKFHDFLPLPEAVKVIYAPNIFRLSRPDNTIKALLDIARYTLRSPRQALRLFNLIRSDPKYHKLFLHSFIRYLPFLLLKPDVIQFDFPMTGHFYRLLPKFLNAPNIVSCRGADIHMAEHRDEHNKYVRLSAITQATIVHCVSEEMAQEVARVSKRTDGLWVNRPAVPINHISSKQHYNNNEIPLLITVGRLTWKKGLDYLLAALTRLKARNIPFRAQIIGDGELKAVLRFSIEDLNLTNEVQMLGSLPPDQVLEHLQYADIFVLSSQEEGISNAVLEAMASGLPVVTTSAGGMAEAVRDGIDGFVVPVRAITEMADRLEQLLLDPALRETMGHSARSHVEAEFTVERQAKVFEEMYHATAHLSNLGLPIHQ